MWSNTLWVIVVHRGQPGYISPKEVHLVYGTYNDLERAAAIRDEINNQVAHQNLHLRFFAEVVALSPCPTINSDTPTIVEDK